MQETDRELEVLEVIEFWVVGAVVTWDELSEGLQTNLPFQFGGFIWDDPKPYGLMLVFDNEAAARQAAKDSDVYTIRTMRIKRDA